MHGIDEFIDYSVLVVQVSLGLFLFSLATIYLPNRWGAPWVITTPRIIQRMLDLADLKPGEKLIDLGAGDGRIVITAARDYGADGFGVEIDPLRCVLAKLFIWRNRVRGKAEVRWGDIHQTDLGGAKVITMYLTRDTNHQLRSILEERCEPGTRIVSYAFPIPGWTPTIIDDFHLIFVYEAGNTGDEVIIKFV